MPDLAHRVALCDTACSLEHVHQDREQCCGEELVTGPTILTDEAVIYAQALAEARDDDEALSAAITFYRSAADRAYALVRDEGDMVEEILLEALALRLPASIYGHPQAQAARARLVLIGDLRARRTVQVARMRTPRRAKIRPYEALQTIEGLLQLASAYERAARWSRTMAARQRALAVLTLHEAFMVAVQFRRTELVCPTLLASALTSPQLAFDAKICLGETDDRPALRAELDRMSRSYRRDVTLWSRYLRVGHPIQSAAIATAALSVGSAASALFFNSRYLALCRMTTDELRCVGDEPTNATAARSASIAFGIAAPALLLTSGYLFVLRVREKREHQRRRCLPFIAGGARTAAASVTCRF